MNSGSSETDEVHFVRVSAPPPPLRCGLPPAPSRADRRRSAPRARTNGFDRAQLGEDSSTKLELVQERVPGLQ
jgi:hypothetical protein